MMFNNNKENGAGGFNVPNPSKIIKTAIVVVVVLLLAVVGMSSFTTIPAGCTGVITQFGAVSEIVLQEGLHMKIPFIQQVHKIDNRVMKIEVDATSASKDLQTLKSTISLNYRVDKNSSANLLKNVGSAYEDIIIRPAIQECVKAVTARYTAEELITKRQDVGEQMRELVSDKIDSFGLRVEIFNIINFDFSEEFNRAIESKQTAQQNALRAEQELAKVRVDAQQKVEEAKADALAIREKADAEAYAIEKIQQQLAKDPTYVQYLLAINWDGKQPLVVGGDGGNILDLGRLMDATGNQTTNNNAPENNG